MCKDRERREYSVGGLYVNVTEAQDWGRGGYKLGPSGIGLWIPIRSLGSTRG